MEITSPRINTLKITTKKGYVLVDPDSAEEAKVVILSDGIDSDIKQTPDNLVIYGPGDFESSGILIKGTRVEGGTIYAIDTEEGKVLVAVSSTLAKLTDEEEYDAVVVKVVGQVDEAALSAISSKIVLVYGEESNIPDSVKSHKTNKLNLKKLEEYGSNVVYLEKK